MTKSLQLRIVAADDERDTREWFGAILPRLGHEVLAVVGTGAELIAACKRHRPDLVLTDVRMPDMDGLDALAAVSPVRAIVLSGYQDAATKERVHALGAFFLPKPVRGDQLQAAIENLFAGDRS